MNDITKNHNCKGAPIEERSIYYNRFQKKWGVLTSEIVYCPTCGILMRNKEDHKCKNNNGHPYYIFYNYIAKKYLTFARHDISYCNLCGKYIKGVEIKDGE